MSTNASRTEEYNGPGLCYEKLKRKADPRRLSERLKKKADTERLSEGLKKKVTQDDCLKN